MSQRWDPSHKSSLITISNSGRTASGSGATSNQSVYGLFYSLATSKIYWEINVTELVTEDVGVGLGTITSDVSVGAGRPNWVGSDSGTIGWYSDGRVFFNTLATATWGAWSGSALLCLALDGPNGTLYGRVGTAGNWNASGSGNPATNVGGLPLGFVGPYFPGLTLFTAGETGTANFAAATWQGVAPAGFAEWPDQTGGMGILISLPVV